MKADIKLTTENVDALIKIESLDSQGSIILQERTIDFTVSHKKEVTEADLNFDLHYLKGDKGDTGEKGDTGDTGFSPTAIVESTTDGAKVTITDKSGTTTANITNGVDGFTPSASVVRDGDKTTISITDKTGTTTADIYEGIADAPRNGLSYVRKDGKWVSDVQEYILHPLPEDVVKFFDGYGYNEDGTILEDSRYRGVVFYTNFSYWVITGYSYGTYQFDGFNDDGTLINPVKIKGSSNKQRLTKKYVLIQHIASMLDQANSRYMYSVKQLSKAEYDSLHVNQCVNENYYRNNVWNVKNFYGVWWTCAENRDLYMGLGYLTKTHALNGTNADFIPFYLSPDLTGHFSHSPQITEINLGNKEVSGSLGYMCSMCYSLKRADLHQLKASNITTINLMFYGCSRLEWLDIRNIDCSSVTTHTSVYANSPILTTLIGDSESLDEQVFIGMTKNITLSSCSGLLRPSLRAVINGIADMTGQDSPTLNLGSTLRAKLEQEDIDIAINKNWIIA